MNKTLLSLVALLCVTIMFSQTSSRMNYKRESAKKNANYFQILSSKRAEIANYDLTKLEDLKEYKHFERWAYFWKDRIDANGNFPSANLGYYNAGIIDANGKIISKPKTNISNKILATWSNVGPGTTPVANGYPNFPQMGRLNSFYRFRNASDANLSVLFVGSPAGGIWRSMDNGSNWTPQLDLVAGIGVTDIRAKSSATYSSSSILYASTGDYDGSHVNSIGVLKSTDGGSTWSATGLSFTVDQAEVTSNLIVIDDQTVIVGTKFNIKKTTNGGTTWTDVKSSPFNDNFGRFVVSNNKYMCADQWGGIFMSTDLGNTWTEVNPSGNNQDKTALAAEGDIFYAINSTGVLKKYDTAAASSSWVTMGITVPTYDAQGGYNQALNVRSGLIISGAFNGYTSRDDGTTWTKTLNGYWNSSTDPGTYIHSDWHNVGHLDGDGTFDYWSVNDGGLSFLTFSSLSDITPSVTYKSDGVVNTQLYSAAITPNSSSGNMLIGNQDNDGFSREMHAGSMQWIAASAGDGTATAIDYNDTNKRYLGGTQGDLTATDIGFSGNYQGTLNLQTIPGAAFIWPLEMHTTDPTILYAGGDDVYKLNTSGGAHTGLNSGAGQITFISTHGAGIAIMGANALKMSTDSGANWTALTEPSSDANAKANSLDFSGTSSNTIYATTGGYVSGSKVFKSTDGGQNWTNISLNLPNILMKEILFHQTESSETLFVATEMGVYIKIGSSNWEKLGGDSFPNVIVNDIDINYTANKLVAATFGRGLWEIDIATLTLSYDQFSLANKNTTVFPNPVNGDFLNVNLKGFNNSNQNYNYYIYNVVGGIVKSGRLDSDSNQLNLSNIAPGIYLFKVAHGREVSVKKIIKE